MELAEALRRVLILADEALYEASVAGFDISEAEFDAVTKVRNFYTKEFLK